VFQDPAGDYRAELVIVEREHWGVLTNHELELVVKGDAIGGRWRSDIVGCYMQFSLFEKPRELTESTSPIEYLVGGVMIIVEVSQDLVGHADIIISRGLAVQVVETAMATFPPPLPKLNEGVQLKSDVRRFVFHRLGVMRSSPRKESVSLNLLSVSYDVVSARS
jgi:hypothetical protein